jgi:hypothetical protein
MAFFVVSPRFSETTVLLFPAVAELGPVDFPLSPCIVLFVVSLPSEETCCATAPANGAASRPAANTIDREIEVITDILSSLSRLCGDIRSKRRGALAVLYSAMQHTQNRLLAGINAAKLTQCCTCRARAMTLGFQFRSRAAVARRVATGSVSGGAGRLLSAKVVPDERLGKPNHQKDGAQ